MSPADLDLHDGYNCREKQQRSRVNGRLRAFGDLKDRSDGSIGRRRGSVIQPVRTRVAKCRHPPKNQEFDFVAKTVLNVDIALLLGKIRLECLCNFGYFATMTLIERSM